MKRHARRSQRGQGESEGSMESMMEGMDSDALVAIGAPLAAIGMLMLVPSVRRRVMRMSRGLIRQARKMEPGQVLTMAGSAAAKAAAVEGLKTVSAQVKH